MSSLFQKCEVPPKSATDPVINKSTAKTMMLPKFPQTMEEHLTQWAAFLEAAQEENETEKSLIRKFRDLVYSRKERMQNMLQSSKHF